MRHIIALQALTPVSHGDTASGSTPSNTKLFMRQQAIVNGRSARVPSISENALRSVIFRHGLHNHLIQALNVQKGSLSQSVVNLLFSGGSLAAGSSSPTSEMELGHNVKKLYPSIDLLGGATDSFILPKGRLRLSAWIVCQEYLDAIEAVAPEYAEEAGKISVFDMIGDEVRTRGTGEESTGNQMIYGYETLAAGSKIIMEVTLDTHTPDVTKSALAVALASWDGFIGGQGRQGRGRMHVISHDLPSGDLYQQHLTEHADAMIAGLTTGTFGTSKVLCA